MENKEEVVFKNINKTEEKIENKIENKMETFNYDFPDWSLEAPKTIVRSVKK